MRPGCASAPTTTRSPAATRAAPPPADHFVDVAGFQSGDLLPVLDVEITNGLSKTAMQAWVAQFLDRVFQRTGVRTVIYTSPSFWKTNLGDTTAIALSGYSVLWVAHWTTATSPTVPASNWGGFGWTVWQWTDRARGRHPVAVDRDRLNGTDITRLLIP